MEDWRKERIDDLIEGGEAIPTENTAFMDRWMRGFFSSFKFEPNNESQAITKDSVKQLPKTTYVRLLWVVANALLQLFYRHRNLKLEHANLQQQVETMKGYHNLQVETARRTRERTKAQLRAVREIIDSFGAYGLEDKRGEDE